MTFDELPAPPVPAYQCVSEFGMLWSLVASRPHARVLEIGSLFGGTLWYWSHLPKIETLVTVDLPSEWEPIYEGVREARKEWAGWMPKGLRFVDYETDSRDPNTLHELGSLQPFDFAFIDGDHGYDGVKADWLAYSPLVRSGGIVAFHDTWPNPLKDSSEPGVVRWVDELRTHLPSIEWTDPDGVGICAFTLP